MSRLVCGVGVNDAGYAVTTYKDFGYVNGKQKRKLVWCCPFYQTWRNMLERGYFDKFKLTNPTYNGVTVCKEWHTFSTFKSWMEDQDWEGKQLDKDLFVKGNKEYNPESCVFVSRQVNGFLIDSGKIRGNYKVGVCLVRGKYYMAQCSNPITLNRGYLGYFPTEELAHQAWLAKKLEHAYALASIQADQRVANALIERYENYVAA